MNTIKTTKKSRGFKKDINTMSKETITLYVVCSPYGDIREIYRDKLSAAYRCNKLNKDYGCEKGFEFYVERKEIE